jgi:hypothetical protein
MTDRYYALTVVLEKDIRKDDAEQIINAIRMIKYVLDVKGNVSNPDTWMAESRAKREIGDKLFNVIYPKIKDEK